MLEIRPVLGRGEFNEFIRLPRRLYAGLPGFVPPLDMERRQLLDPGRAPFGRNGESFRWLAWRDGKAVGRISAQVDAAAIQAWGAPTGTFGALDAIDDAAVVAALIETAAGQLRSKGLTRMRGPLTPNINGETGLLIDGHAWGAMLLMPWHPDYLARHAEAAGLAKAKDVVSYAVKPEQNRERVANALARAGELLGHDYRFRDIQLGNLASEVEVVRAIYNGAWKDNWGFVPVSAAEAAYLAQSIRPIVTPDSVIVLEKAGVPIATALVVPNFYEYVGDMDGRLLPFNWLRLLVRVRRGRFRSLRVILFGVHPVARSDPFVTALMFQEMLRRSARYRFERGEYGWILEDKRDIIDALERNGAVRTTTHRVYEMAL